MNKLRVILAGGSGFLGTLLTKALRTRGYEVFILDLKKPKSLTNHAIIDLSERVPNSNLLEGSDAVINLTGAPLFGNFTPTYKKRLRDSRIKTTEHLIESVKKCKKKPKVFVCASAVGVYADGGNQELTERSPKDTRFIAQLVQDWEKSANKAKKLKIRVVHIRTAPVLGPGGLLKTMTPYFGWGLGAVLGSGNQYFPWVHYEDIINAYIAAIENKKMTGPYNVCSPEAVTNKEFSDMLAHVMHRPRIFRAPAWVLRHFMGEVAEEILISTRAVPRKIEKTGFVFKHSDLFESLDDVISRYYH